MNDTNIIPGIIFAASDNSTSTSTNATEIKQMANGRCLASRAPQEGPPLFQNGTIVFQAHDVGWIVCCFFTIIACGVSFWLINKHLMWYTNRKEQRYIVRILFMVPIYAIISTLSFFLWDHATALLLVRDGYEGIVLVSFFYLLLTYLSPDPETQKSIFRIDGLSKQNDIARKRRGEPPQHWFFPLGKIKWKPADGMYFLQLMKWLVLQYIIVRPGTTFVAVILNYVGLYCEESWGLGWGHIWITSLVSISVTVAMYCLVQLYLPISYRLTEKRPVLKLFSIKAVVFLTFWQASFLSLLATFNVVRDTPYMTATDINTGWGAIVETFEMSIFAFLHVKAFSYRPYRIPSGERTPRLRALLHAFDFRETWREISAGWLYGWRRMRGVEVDVQARREQHLESAFERSRLDVWTEKDEKMRAKEGTSKDKEPRLTVGVETVVEVEGERQWLVPPGGRRAPSDALGVQIERELQRRGLFEQIDEVPSPQRRRSSRIQRSWWRRIHDRFSISRADDGDEESSPLDDPDMPHPHRHRHRSRSRHADEHARLVPDEYDDVPPPSLIRSYHRSHEAIAYAPLPVDSELPVPRITMSQPPGPSTPLPGRLFRMPLPSPSESTPSLAFAPSSSHESRTRHAPHLRHTGTGRAVQLTVPTPLAPQQLIFAPLSEHSSSFSPPLHLSAAPSPLPADAKRSSVATLTDTMYTARTSSSPVSDAGPLPLSPPHSPLKGAHEVASTPPVAVWTSSTVSPPPISKASSPPRPPLEIYQPPIRRSTSSPRHPSGQQEAAALAPPLPPVRGAQRFFSSPSREARHSLSQQSFSRYSLPPPHATSRTERRLPIDKSTASDRHTDRTDRAQSLDQSSPRQPSSPPRHAPRPAPSLPPFRGSPRNNVRPIYAAAMITAPSYSPTGHVLADDSPYPALSGFSADVGKESPPHQPKRTTRDEPA